MFSSRCVQLCASDAKIGMSEYVDNEKQPKHHTQEEDANQAEQPGGIKGGLVALLVMVQVGTAIQSEEEREEAFEEEQRRREFELEAERRRHEEEMNEQLEKQRRENERVQNFKEIESRL